MKKKTKRASLLPRSRMTTLELLKQHEKEAKEQLKKLSLGTMIGGLLRINRITGIAKVYEWDYKLGKFKLYKEEKYTYKYKRSMSDIEKMLLNREKE